MKTENGSALHQRIFDLVESIPAGKVATYGQIGKLVGGCSGRMVGFALASLRYKQRCTLAARDQPTRQNQPDRTRCGAAAGITGG